MSNHLSMLAIMESLQKAAKKKPDEGQYAVIPDWMFSAANSTEPLTSSQRSQAKRIFSGATKINPEDFKKIVNTRNLDLSSMIASKPDLTNDQARMILDHETPFARTVHYVGTGKVHLDPEATDRPQREINRANKPGYARNQYGNDRRTETKKKETFQKLISVVQSHGKMDDFLENGGHDAVMRHITQSNRDDFTPTQAFHLITNRKDMSPLMLENMYAHHGSMMDEGHLVELLNRPEGALHAVGLSHAGGRSGSTISGNVVDAVMRNNNPESVKAVVGNQHAALTQAQLMSALSHTDADVRSAAHDRAGLMNHPSELSRHAFAGQIIQHSQPQDLKTFLKQLNRHVYELRNFEKLSPDLENTLLSRWY